VASPWAARTPPRPRRSPPLCPPARPRLPPWRRRRRVRARDPGAAAHAAHPCSTLPVPGRRNLGPAEGASEGGRHRPGCTRLDGLVAARGNLRRRLAALEARVRIKVLALCRAASGGSARARCGSSAMVAMQGGLFLTACCAPQPSCGPADPCTMPGCMQDMRGMKRTVGSPPASLMSASLAPSPLCRGQQSSCGSAGHAA